MKCPACKTQMFVVEYDALELDHCPTCEGTWFDSDELGLLFADENDDPHPELVQDVVDGHPEVDTGEARRRCPECNKTMRKVNIGPSRRVLVDACPQGHGLWFDRGEVADLAVDLAVDPANPPARVLDFLGGLLGFQDPSGRDAAAEPDKES